MTIQKYDIDYHNLGDFLFEDKKYSDIATLKEALRKSNRNTFIVFCPDSRKVAEEKFEKLSQYFERIYTPIKWVESGDSFCTIKI